jgi:phage gp36-like protein
MYSDKEYFLTKIDSDELNKLVGDSEENLDSAIASADSLIDSYLTNAVTTVPLAEPPEVIKQCSFDIAMYHLHDRVQFVDIPERIKTKYDDAISFLKDVARGIANIPGLSTDDSESGINYDANNNVMGRESI